MLKKMKLNNIKLYTMTLLTITCVLPLIGMDLSAEASSSSSSEDIPWITFRKDEISQSFDTEGVTVLEKILFEPPIGLEDLKNKLASQLKKKLALQQVAKFLYDQHTLMQKIKFLLDEHKQALLYTKQNTDFADFFVELPHDDDEKTVSSKISPKKDFSLDSPEQYSLIIFFVQAQLNKPSLRNVIEKLKPFLNIENSAVHTYTLSALIFFHRALRDRIFDQVKQEAQSLAPLLSTEDQFINYCASSGYLYPLMKFNNIIGDFAKRYDKKFTPHICFTDRIVYTELQKLVEWYQAQEQFRILYERILEQKYTTSSTTALPSDYFRKELAILDFPMDKSPFSFNEIDDENLDGPPIKETELLHILGAELGASSDTSHTATSERRKKSKKPHKRKSKCLKEEKACVASAAASSSSSSKSECMPTSPKKDALPRTEVCMASAAASSSSSSKSECMPTLPKKDLLLRTEACVASAAASSSSSSKSERMPTLPKKDALLRTEVCVASAAASSSSSSKSECMPTLPKKDLLLRTKALNTRAWQYDARVTEWHTDPETALKIHGDVDGSPTKEDLQEIIIRHRLPYVLEDRFQQLAVIKNKTVENKKTGEAEKQITLNFPGAMQFPDGNTHYGIFTISLNPANNHVYHRFFHTTPSLELANMLQTCIDKLEDKTIEGDTVATPHDDLVFDATHIEENALAVHIVDRYGIEYILFKGHMLADA